MFDQTQMKQLIQAAEQAWYARAPQTCLIRGCPNEQNITHQTREQKKCFTFLIECLMAFKFYQTRPNTINHDQRRSNSTKEGVQTVKCLVTKQCLMVFGRQTFITKQNAKCRHTYCELVSQYVCKTYALRLKIGQSLPGGESLGKGTNITLPVTT